MIPQKYESSVCNIDNNKIHFLSIKSSC